MDPYLRGRLSEGARRRLSLTNPGGGPHGPPPLALYVHVPWCVSKCPYCDFNSHALRDDIPEASYVDTLLYDLDQELRRLPPPVPLVSVFIGGGTPSLLSGVAITCLLAGIRSRAPLTADAEVTLEANPGTADAHKFAAYRAAGVNRLSMGVQSLSPDQLKRLGRIHGPDEARDAFRLARESGFENINLDLMYGLPDQGLQQAREDLERALELEPEHLSYYQLTLEPNTVFFAAPPTLPDDDLTADMQLQGAELLAKADFDQYEVSAYARPRRHCRHNINYWTFGDYLGIGAGAHGKRTDTANWHVERSAKLGHPSAYLEPRNRDHLVNSKCVLVEQDLILEFAMNAFRLTNGFAHDLFERHTGLGFDRIAERIAKAEFDGLLTQSGTRINSTERGRLFLNNLIALFASDHE